MQAPALSRIAAAALLAGAAATAPATAAGQTIATDPGVTFVATALTGFATVGADMGGLQVTAFFSDGSSAGGAWGDLGGGAWGVSLPSFTLSVGAGSDTFSAPWTFANASGLGLTRLVLNGAPGRSVFDIGGPADTPGSANGAAMTVVGGDVWGTTATYQNLVRIGALPAAGDLYETLDVTFQTPVSANGFQFVTDTDNVGVRGTITTTPEPATYALMATGLLAIAVVRRRRLA